MNKILGIILAFLGITVLTACEPTINKEVLFVADSVTLQSADPIIQEFNNVEEGDGGRYAPNFGSVINGQGLTKIADRTDRAQLDAYWAEHVASLMEEVNPSVVIVALGYVDCERAVGYGDRIDNFMENVPPTTDVLWLTLGDADRKFTCDTTLNTAINAAPARWDNMRTLPFASFVNAHPEWTSDSIHLNEEGRLAYAEWLRQRLDAIYPPN